MLEVEEVGCSNGRSCEIVPRRKKKSSIGTGYTAPMIIATSCEGSSFCLADGKQAKCLVRKLRDGTEIN